MEDAKDENFSRINSKYWSKFTRNHCKYRYVHGRRL